MAIDDNDEQPKKATLQIPDRREPLSNATIERVLQ
jgi:hypothetical protein